MAKKPTYEELEQKVEKLKNEAFERKQAEDALRESEERYRGLVETMADGLVIQDENGLIIYVNNRFCKMVGYQQDELIGKPIIDLLDERNKQIVKGEIARRRKGAPTQSYETEITIKDGSQISVVLSPRDILDSDGQFRGSFAVFTDISSRKQAEEALAEANNIINRSPAVAFLWKNEEGWPVEFVSENVEKLFGYSAQEFLEKKISFSDVIHSNDLERVAGEVTSYSKKEGLQTFAHEPYRIITKNGDVKWIDDITYIRRDPLGIITHYEGIVYDISERKLAEEKLRASEQRLVQTINFLPDATMVIDLEGKVIAWNRAIENMTGIKAQEILGKGDYEYAIPFYGERRPILIDIVGKWNKEIEKKYQYVKKEGESLVSETYDSRVKPGGFLWNKASLLYDHNGEAIGAIESIRDITYRKVAEQALRESEAQKRAILDGITTNLTFVNENLEVLWANKVAVDSINSTWDEVIGHKCYELWADPKTPCDGCPTVKAFKTQKSEQCIMRTPDGRVWDEKGEPVFDENGEIMGVLEIAHDITEKINAEEELRASEERLARSKKMEAMGLMAGGVAHDLNNILSGLVSYPELLLMDLPEDSPLRKPIKTIQESGMRAADVVEDLLTIARGVASGKEVLNLNTMVEEYLDSAEHHKLEKIHPLTAFKTELESELLNITGSASHVKKILMNLIVNASEAIEGKGTVAVSTINRYLDQPLKGYEDVRIGEYVVLAISDDGSGISPQDIDRIFEPFYTKKVMSRSGTGLGLAVVWNSMQDHNGYINVKSSEKGTAFELYFPTTREQVADEKEEVPLEDYLGHGEKILLVDDEERQREIASGILTRLGYTAEVVSSGEEAIEYVKENPVDLIVLDMVMPKGINGRKTYEEIIKIRPGQKAIIASGYAKTKEVDLAQELGAGKYIKKPYTLAKVGLAVKEELAK